LSFRDSHVEMVQAGVDSAVTRPRGRSASEQRCFQFQECAQQLIRLDNVATPTTYRLPCRVTALQ